MTLKELEKLLRGTTEFILESRDEDGNIIQLDKVLIYEIKYLPASLLKRTVLQIDLETNIITLDIDRTVY